MKLLVCAAAVSVAAALTSCSMPSDTPPTDSLPGGAGSGEDRVYATSAEVLAAVAEAQTLTAVPPKVAAGLAKDDQVKPRDYFDCGSVDNVAEADLYGDCFYGDPNGEKTMAIYGDSSADMGRHA